MIFKTDVNFLNSSYVRQVKSSIPEGKTIFGVDFNSWHPHILATLEILSAFSEDGFETIYHQKQASFLPEYQKPYFGTKPMVDVKFLEKYNIARPVKYVERTDERFVTESQRAKLLFRLNKISNQKQLASLDFNGFDYGYAILSSLASKYGLGELSETLIKQDAPQMLDEFLDTCNFIHRTILEENVGCLVIFNGRFINERAAWRTGQSLGIPVLLHESSKNLHYTVSQDSPHSLKNYGFLMQTLTAKASDNEINSVARDWFIERITGKNVDNARFQTKWIAGSLPKVKEGKRGIISIFSTSDDEYIGISPEWDLPQMLTQQEWLEKVIDHAISAGYDVYLRLHPNLNTKSYSLQNSWKSMKRIEGLRLIHYRDPMNSYDLIRASDLVITCGSTIAMEAGFLKKPVLSVGTGIYDGIGAVVKVQELNLIQEIFRNGNFLSYVPDPFKIAKFAFIEKNKFFPLKFMNEQSKLHKNLFRNYSIFNRLISKVYRVAISKLHKT